MYDLTILSIMRDSMGYMDRYFTQVNSAFDHFERCHLVITEGDSASGSITKARKVETQAVFSLRGKPLNCFGLTKKVVYENEEFNLLQHALNIEESYEDLRYNNIVIATDADVDGAHIRTLLLTLLYRHFRPIIEGGFVYIAQPPLYKITKGKTARYAYGDSEKEKILKELGVEGVSVASIAKGVDRDAGREQFFIPGREPFRLPPRDPALYFIQRLRDEAHRFAIGTHRAKRKKAFTANPLDEIPGIGPRRKRALLLHFGTAKAIAQASFEDLTKAPGVNEATAKAVYDFFHDGGR